MTAPDLAPVLLDARPRDLTPAEQARLATSVARVRSLLQPLDAAAIERLWDHALAGAPDDPEAARVVGVAVGSVLIDTVPSARWVAGFGPRGWTPAVVSAAQPTAPVLVVADALQRWADGSRGWLPPYLDGAVAHLAEDAAAEPSGEVDRLATVALDLGLSLANQLARAFAVVPGSGGPVSSPAPSDPSNAEAVRAWARKWAAGNGSDLLAITWVDPPRPSARHAVAGTGAVRVEAGRPGQRGVVLAHEFSLRDDGEPVRVGGVVMLGDCGPVL